jgi:hypothetical protein
VQFTSAIRNYPSVRVVALKDPDDNAILLAQALSQ